MILLFIIVDENPLSEQNSVLQGHIWGYTVILFAQAMSHKIVGRLI